LKYDPNEPYEKWIERVRIFEYGRALQRIAGGDSIELVMEEMSRKITDKMLHPILMSIKTPMPTKEEIQKSREKYEEIYLKRNKPAADQVDGQLFDNSK
jgi:glutamyl-tRNA reductase